MKMYDVVVRIEGWTVGLAPGISPGTPKANSGLYDIDVKVTGEAVLCISAGSPEEAIQLAKDDKYDEYGLDGADKVDILSIEFTGEDEDYDEARVEWLEKVW